jgi:hypothetical protein
MEIPEDKIRKIMKIAKEPISHGDPDRRRRRFSHLGDFIEDSANTAPMRSGHAGRPARRGQRHPGQPDAARSQGAAHALWHRDGQPTTRWKKWASSST